MRESQEKTNLVLGLVAGLLLAFGITAGLAAYIGGPGRVPSRMTGLAQTVGPLPAWSDPNAGMRNKEDRIALFELIRRQDEENAAHRGLTDTTPRNVSRSEQDEGADEGEFDIELRPPTTAQAAAPFN